MMVELSNVDTSSCPDRAPIDTLPNELLSDIFAMGAASPPFDWEQLPFPLLVSSISQRWRETAISSPALWSQMSFTADPRSCSWAADLFLPRSGSHPLDISIALPRDRSCQSMYRVLQCILPHHARWRKLCVRVRVGNYDTGALLMMFQRFIRNISAPLLQRFEFLYGLDSKSACIHCNPSFILGAPVLTSVTLRGLCWESAPPLANLTSFQFESPVNWGQSDLEDIVTASPALRVLHLRLKGLEASGSGGPINLPSLRELSLNFLHWDRSDTGGPHIEPLHLLAVMVAPALESLELVSLAGYDVDAQNTLFQRFPDHPHPQILKLCNIAMTLPNSYGALLSLFPTVTSLYLLGTAEEPTLSLLPALKSVTYHLQDWLRRESGRVDSCMRWLCRHVQDCHGTPRAMQSVCISTPVRNFGRRGDAEEVHYRTMRGLVELVELDEDEDCFQSSWPEDEEGECDE